VGWGARAALSSTAPPQGASRRSLRRAACFDARFGSSRPVCPPPGRPASIPAHALPWPLAWPPPQMTGGPADLLASPCPPHLCVPLLLVAPSCVVGWLIVAVPVVGPPPAGTTCKCACPVAAPILVYRSAGGRAQPNRDGSAPTREQHGGQSRSRHHARARRYLS
jgi:hypothetical protein